MNITNIIVKIIDKFENDRNLIEEFTAVGAAKLIYNGADDKYQTIMASEFQFNLMVNDKTDGKFFHLYTGNEKRYLVTVEDQDNNLLFEGFLLPDFYSEPYDNGVIFVDLTATDGLGLLKGQYLPNQYYKQETSVIKLIAECLRFTKLDKNIVFAPAIESAATDYRWDEIVVNGATYLDGEMPCSLNGVYLMPKRKNAYEIIDLLLESLGCTLYSQGSSWYIEGINRKHEENQFVYNYDKDGVYVNTDTIVKEVVDLTFFKTPTISIVSPWKRVDIEWDIDEDGELIPLSAIKFPQSQCDKGPRDFWNVKNVVLTDVQQGFKDVKDIFNFSNQVIDRGPKFLHLYKFYWDTFGQPRWAENVTDLMNNFLDIKKKKYLKVSDKYFTRSLSLEFDLVAGNPFPVLFYTNSGEPVLSDSDFFKNFFKLSIEIGNDLILSTINLGQTPEITTNVEVDPDSEILDIGFGNPRYLLSRHSVKLDLENITLFKNGFFNFKMHAPISPDPKNPYFNGYIVENLKIKYSEQKKWEDYLVRDIDFTTSKTISIFHCDCKQDLSEKQFRFRRYITSGVGDFSIDYIINYSSQTQILGSSSVLVVFVYVISFENAFLLQNSSIDNFYLDLGVFGLLKIQEVYGDDFMSLYNYSLVEENGVWSIRLIAGSLDSSLNFVPINQYFSNINNIVGFSVLSGNLDYGLVEEDNEWRESWKRFGQTESIRYGVALAKIYNDVQPEAMVKIEGEIAGLLFPRQIGRFLWREIKKFIPTRIVIDFSKGRSSVLVLEDLHQNITDYVE